MLNSIEVRNAVGTLVSTLPVKSVSASSPYTIKDISGLDPVKADINTSDYATQDGGFFQSARTGGRNMVFKMGYQPNYVLGKTVETLRRELYSVFPPKGLIELRFFNSDPAFKTVKIQGYVESFSSPPFAKEPEIDVSIICPKPYCNELDVVLKNGYSSSSIIMPYDGDAEVGFTLAVTLLDSTNRLIMKNGIDPDLDLRFQVPNPITGLADPFSPTMFDEVIFSTIPGSKSIILNRGSTVYNLLPYVKSGGLSMKLSPLVNSVTLDVGSSTSPGSEDPEDWEWPIISSLQLRCTPAYLGL